MTFVGEYPDLGLLAARVAALHGLKTVLVLGPVELISAALAHPEVEFVEIVSGVDGHVMRPRPGSRGCLPLGELGAQLLASKRDIVASSLVICTALDFGVGRAGSLPGNVRSILERAPVSIVACPDTDSGMPLDIGEALSDQGVTTTFAGRTQRFRPNDAAIAIIDRVVGDVTEPAPDDFRVVAVMTAYNEADVIGPSIEALIDGGINVYLIDNWSTDETYEIASRFSERGLVGAERFPDAPTAVYDWTGLLRRVEDVTSNLKSDWFIHHDADERREGPWPSRSLRDSLWVVDKAGFNAVDHTVLNFRPVDNGYAPGTDYVRYFRGFEFGDTPDMLVQVKAWKGTGRRVSLAESGGHDVTFAGRHVFPYKFVLKHYPIRSQAHGERKVRLDRQARWAPSERAKGWHVQYEGVTATHSFLQAKADLLEFDDEITRRDYLVPIVSGVGLQQPARVPKWAEHGRLRRATYAAIRRLDVGSVGLTARRTVFPRIPLARRIARRLKRALYGPPR